MNVGVEVVGHYCKVCARWCANEKFSGKGHKNHVCKDCSKKTIAQRKDKKADKYDWIDSMETDISGQYEYNDIWLTEISRKKINDPCDDEEIPF